MRTRFPLLLKKRGGRRTGSRGWSRAAEIINQITFILAGAVGAWWCLTDVLLPERRLANESEGFVAAAGQVIDQRVTVRPGLAEDEYCPELLVRFEPQDGLAITAWTRHGVGRDTPSRAEAEAALDRFTGDQSVDCWYDPERPNRFVLAKGGRWWPWFVLVIPVSLVIAGCFGLWRALVRVQASAERRAMRGAPASGRADIAEQESPGTRLAHRLPLDGGEGWRLSGMAALCVLWNVLAGLVVYQAIGLESVSGRIGLTALAVAPLAATGAWMVRSLWRDATMVGGFGATRVEIDQHPLMPGQACRGMLIQSGAGRVRLLSVSLVCEETAAYLQGTDSRVATLEAFRTELHRERGLMIDGSKPHELGFELTIPEAGPLAFRSAHNAVRWAIEVRLAPAHAAEAPRRFPLVVVAPAPTAVPDSPRVRLSDAAVEPEAIARPSELASR
ncbi:MAG: hypothetical protein AAFV43_15200 [Planctomycetota bacterium]